MSFSSIVYAAANLVPGPHIENSAYLFYVYKESSIILIP